MNFDECYDLYVPDEEIQALVDRYENVVGFVRTSANMSNAKNNPDSNMKTILGENLDVASLDMGVIGVKESFEFCINKVVENRTKKQNCSCVIF